MTVRQSGSHSPYSTGGGGFTFEHRVGAAYLARLITNSPLSELDERVVATVAFQQAPSSAVDDLVVTARSNDGSIPIRLAIACRRRPQFTRGNAKTKELFAQLVRASRAADDDSDVDQRLAVAVAGSQGGALEVSELAGVARNQHNPAGFFDLINGSGQFSNKLRTRLAHLRDLVQLAQATNGEPDVSAEERCWRLLTQLRVLGPSIEPTDDQDWVDLVSLLEPWAAKGTMESAIALRNQLEALAAEYAQTAAAVDANTVRRRVHSSIDTSAHRMSLGWTRLKLLDVEARAAVSRSLVGSGVDEPLKLARSELQTNLAASLAQGTEDLVVRGESGVGKSALVFDAMEKAASEDCEFIAVNLRDLPQTILELLDALSVPLEQLLAGMTAPRRILVVDAAEAVAESKKDVFGHILRAARRSGVRVVAVAAEAAGAVAEDMKVGGNTVTEFEVSGLSDDEVSQAVDHFSELDRLATSPKGRELLRRPIVIELLSRAGGSRTPLSDAEAHAIVWHDLVRNGERHDAGLPDAREQTMLSLATSALSASTSHDSLGTLDAAAVNGLIKSGLLRRSGSLPWEREPTFAHDLLREYSVARVLVAMKDPAAELRRFGAPRWTLPAARLACQLVLTNPGNPGDIPALFRRLQSDFEELATSGFGERWVDVPTEALVAMAEPTTVLERAWDFLIDSEAAGVRRLIRVLDLRHRKDHFIDTLVADPIVAQLVKAGAPQGLGEEAAELTKDWLTAHVLRGTPAGHPVRTALANKIVTLCTNNEAEAERRDTEAAAARAARTPQEIAEEEERIKKFAAFSEIGFPRRRRRVPKRRRPYEWIDDEAITHLALLGPDLGSEGEAILRRIADDEPGSLDHAVETPLAGNALALFDPNLLVDLVAAYYLEDEYEDDAGFGYSGIHEDGIRDHRFGGIGGPLAAYYKGPFITMFRTNYRAGVACLNKLLNHAARHRVRTLANIGYPNAAPDEKDRYKVELSITGDKRAYIGDDHVWLWYRGTGVGPYPCMSALQALELVNDELIRVGIPVTQLVPILLEGAESLAIPALVLGTLVRHLEQSGDALFPFLVEPSVWELEFARHVHESDGLAARTPDLDHPERRSWSLRETSMMLTLQAQGDRVGALKELGDQLIAAVKAQIGDNESDAAKQHLAAVQGWAASLDRNAYEIKEHEGQYVIQQAPNPEIEAVLAGPNAELLRGNEALGLTLRHVHNRTEDGGAYGMSSEELAKDLATARELIENPPSTGMGTSPDGPVAVAASAIELFFARGLHVTAADLEWSAQMVLEVAGSVAERPLRDGDPSYFMQGVDRSAARALPYLLLPAARDLRAALGIDTGDANDLLVSLNEAVAVGASNEARLEYARSLDEVWHAPCPSKGKCHHQVAFEIVQASFRDCILGPWDNEGQKREIVALSPPFVESLAKAQEDQILVDQLGPAIRASGSAGVSEACCRQEARDALDVLLAAHRRGMLAYEHGYMHSDSDSLIAARAALWQVIDGREQPLLNHVAGYLSNSRLLGESLRAINAAAEERGPAAEAARRLWPTVMELVLDAADANPHILSERRHGDRAFSELIPNPTYAFGYLTLELEHESVKWRDLLSWSDQVEHWVSMASGRESIDALVTAVGELAREDQVRIGLSWIERVVHASGNNCAYTYTLPEWLHERRADLTTSEQQARWQRVVDLLLLAGDRRVADLAD